MTNYDTYNSITRWMDDVTNVSHRWPPSTWGYVFTTHLGGPAVYTTNITCFDQSLLPPRCQYSHQYKISQCTFFMERVCLVYVAIYIHLKPKCVVALVDIVYSTTSFQVSTVTNSSNNNWTQLGISPHALHGNCPSDLSQPILETHINRKALKDLYRKIILGTCDHNSTDELENW